MNEQSQFGNQRPEPSFGNAFVVTEHITKDSIIDTMQVHAAAPRGVQMLLQTDELPKDYSVSVEEIRLLLFENGIEKSKDAIQRYCREDRLDAVKLGLLRRYFATPLSVQHLLEPAFAR